MKLPDEWREIAKITGNTKTGRGRRSMGSHGEGEGKSFEHEGV